MLFNLISKYYKKKVGKLIIGFSFLIVVDIAQLIIPRFIKRIIDAVLIDNDVSHLLLYTIAILSMGISIGIFRFV